MPESNSPTDGGIDTGGGAHVGGTVNTGGGMFVGRDHVTNTIVNISAGDLERLAGCLFSLLAASNVTLGAGRVAAGDRAEEVSPVLADALRQFVDAEPGATQTAREGQYLLHLCVNPEFQQWQQRYVAIWGSYQAAPVLTPAYSAILVRGEGPQRQIERVPLPEIRTVMEQHARFILLAQPGAAKTTVLQRIALDHLRLFFGW